MPIDDREQQFERALARHLRDGSSAACPDAEILAAYHERTLSLEEMAKWKDHIAACERCQEALALVEETESVDSEEWQEQNAVLMAGRAAAQPMATHAARLSRQDESVPQVSAGRMGSSHAIRQPRANWKWIAPLGAIAAGVMVWVGAVEVRKQHQEAESIRMAQNQPVEAPPTMTRPAAPRADALERKEADAEKTLRDESAPQTVVPKVAAKAGTPASSPAMVAPGAVGGSEGQLDKKKDATGYGSGAGNGPAAAVPAARVPVAPTTVERGRNEIAAAEMQDAARVSGQVTAPQAGAKQAPAPAPMEINHLKEPKSAGSVVGGNLSTITGTVLDPSGAAIAGAVITAMDTKNGNSKTTVADGAGKFQLTDLPPDQYRVVVASTGFAQSEQRLTLQPKQNQQLQVQLNVGTAAESVEVTAAATTVNTSSSELSTTTRNVTALMQLAAANPQYIVAPDKKVGWRVGDGGKIERTTDHGKTWKEQTSGVTSDLKTGSATSGKVCWIVGKAGTILLTSDGGKHWKQITSPIPDDLGGVHAVNELHASIWDVANRKSYETSDGGETWKRTANE